jgi:glycosyltransferase involved in cell wall biosynthesis
VTAEITARLFTSGYAAFLAEDGYDVHLVADGVDGLGPQLADRGVTVHSLAMSRDPNPLEDGPSLIAMVRLVRSLRPDVVIYATPKASLLAALASWFARVPVRIYALWGIRFETATGVGRFVLRSFERIIARLSTAVVANSASLADRAAVHGIVNRDRISVPAHGSSHGVDSRHFALGAERPPLDEATAAFLTGDEKFTVGYVGRLHPDKGVDTLLEATGLLANRGMDVRVLLVGADEGALASSIDEHGAVHQTGEVSDVRPYLAEFDVLVLMSLREGFPNVVLEAAAMGIPAIVSDATGCIDAVVDGVTGWVVPRGDSATLALRIEDLLRQQPARLALGAAAQKRAERDFEPKAVWRAHERHVAAQLDTVRFQRKKRATR